MNLATQWDVVNESSEEGFRGPQTTAMICDARELGGESAGE